VTVSPFTCEVCGQSIPPVDVRSHRVARRVSAWLIQGRRGTEYAGVNPDPSFPLAHVGCARYGAGGAPGAIPGQATLDDLLDTD
jgi:hypothetical protein